MNDLTEIEQEDETTSAATDLIDAKHFNFTLWSEHEAFDGLLGAVLRDLGLSRTKKRRTALKVLLANLYMAWDNNTRPYVAISKDNSFYSRYPRRYNPLRLGYRTLIDLVNRLKEAGQIDVAPGYYDHDCRRGYRTRIWARESLISCFEPLSSIAGLIESHWQAETIFLRSVKTKRGGQKIPGQLMDYTDTPITERMRWRMGVHNCCLRDLTFGHVGEAFDGVKFTSRRCYRIFNNGDFSCGGRIYGGFWQQLSEEQRLRLTINSTYVEELDYKGLHIRMLYALKGIDLGERDPYLVPGLDPSYRKLFKLAVLIIINAEDRKSAIEAIRGKAKEECPDLKGSIEQLVDLFVESHQPIKEYFYSGYGLKLQAIDAEIMDEVLYQLDIQGIPALPVHDSIVVPIGNRIIVERTMTDCYRMRMGFDPQIDIESSWKSYTEINSLERISLTYC